MPACASVEAGDAVEIRRTWEPEQSPQGVFVFEGGRNPRFGHRRSWKSSDVPRRPRLAGSRGMKARVANPSKLGDTVTYGMTNS